jgi:hypothetical protein
VADVYEFHVVGLLGPVLRGALADLSVDTADRESVLTGTADAPGDVAALLGRLTDAGIVTNQIRISPVTRWGGTT